MPSAKIDQQVYLTLLKEVLTDFHKLGRTEYKPLYDNTPTWKVRLLMRLDRILRKRNFAITHKLNWTKEQRTEGRDWPANADTMVGIKRLENIEFCVGKVLQNNIPGDFIETGVWRGGACIFMQAILKVSGNTNRKVWVADSFEGLPKPDPDKYGADAGDRHYLMEELAISLETVQNNFEKYHLLDDNVKFLKGWFKDTLPDAPIDKLAVIRLDGDMYESTMDGLVNLYPKLSKGGYLIVDDWGAVGACRKACEDYRKEHGITDEVHRIDWTGAYWCKES